MELELFDYDLPRELIAQSKSDPRDTSRLFLLDGRNDRIVHGHHIFREIVDLLDEGDLLVLNRSRVIPARIPAMKSTGGKAEVLLLERKGENGWEALIGGKRIRTGEELTTEDDEVFIKVMERLEEGRCSVSFRRKDARMGHDEIMVWLKEWGLMPTPPYIKKLLEEPEQYQTVYGDIEGSVAAPTAGLHFTNEVLDRIKQKGVRIEYIVLHVGIGTFAPVKSSRIQDHVMEEEQYHIPDSVKEAVKSSVESYRNNGRSKIWTVGTTVMRSLETAFDSNGDCISDGGKTGLYIMPGYDFNLPYKGFITNFHLPRSTPLMLVSAFIGRKNVLEAYEVAIKKGYKFYSLGDSMMIRRD